MENRAGNDRATVIVVVLATPFLLLSAAILGRGLGSARDDSPRVNVAPTPQRAAEPPAREAIEAPEPPAVTSQPTDAVPEVKPAKETQETASASPKAAAAQAKTAVVHPAAGPVAELYDREAYNALRELKSLVESQAWAEAARLVMAFDPARASGVAPWISDTSLAVSLPVAARLTHAEYPQVRQALGEQFEALAGLRVAEAIRQADAAAIEMATDQFAAAGATAEAHAWLADEALASGRFVTASAHYREAAEIDARMGEQLAPRLRLAAAMLGHDAGEPAGDAVKLGESMISAEQFEAFVREMKDRGAADIESYEGRELLPPAAGVSRFKSRLRGSLEGLFMVGSEKGQFISSSPRVQATAIKTVAYIASTQHIAAYDLTQERVVWRSEVSGTKHGRLGRGGVQAVKPAVGGERVVVRLLRDQEMRLCCFDAASGELEWMASPRDGEVIASGAIFLGARLIALSVRKKTGGRRALCFCAFDAHSGERLSEQELLPLGDDWVGSDCLVGRHEAGVVVVAGSMTLSIGESGKLQWIRSGLMGGAEGVSATAIVSNDDVYVLHPDGRKLECLEAATGRRRWTSELPAEGRLVGTTGEAVVMSSQQDDFRLMWIGGTDGRPMASCGAAGFERPDRVEAVFPVEKRLFMLAGGERAGVLDIVELEAAASAAESRF